MIITVPHYGLHELGSGVRLLVQEGEVHTSPGLNLGNRLQIKLADRFMTCPHRINPHDVSDPEVLPDHPLVRAFLPYPSQDQMPIYLSDLPHTQKVIRQLKRLATPSAYDRSYLLLKQEQPREAQSTNLTPMVFSGFTWSQPHRPKRVEQWAEVGSRQLVILAPTSFSQNQPGYLTCDTLEIELLEYLPLEQIGAKVVQNYLMRREPLAA